MTMNNALLDAPSDKARRSGRTDPRHRGTILGLLALSFIAAGGCAQARYNLRWKNKTAPDFELNAAEGGRVKLSDYRGSPVILTFWGYG